MSPSRQDKSESQVLFGRNLRAARTFAGLSQEDLAAASGRSRSLIYATEAGTRNLLFATADALAKALGLTIAQLLQPDMVRQPMLLPDAEPVSPLPPLPEKLAIELSLEDALKAAMAVAIAINQQIVLIDPVTREIRGSVPKPTSRS